MKSLNHTKPPVLAGIALLVIVTICWLSTTRHPSPPSRKAGSPPVAAKMAHRHALADFSQWLDDYSAAGATEREPLAAQGLQLARERRVEMESLIRTDPQRALEQAVTLAVWNDLPPELRAEVEEPFSAMARYQVLPVCGNGNPGEKHPDAVRLTTIDGHPQLTTHVFGRRLGITSKEQAPVQGIRLGNLAALHEGTFRELTDEEIPVATPLYPLANPQEDRDFATGLPLGDAPLTAMAGGKIFRFADRAGFEKFADAIDALDHKPGPHGGSALMFLPYPADGNGGFNLAEVTARNSNISSAWTETKKKVFVIRCDFSDAPNPATMPSKATYEALLNGTVSDNIRDYSYGKTWIEATVSTSVTRLPQTAAQYAQIDSEESSSNDELINEAKATYQTANPGFSAGDYDIVGVWFDDINMKSGGVKYAGLAGGGALWIQGTEDAGVHVHEFGHNYGVLHSSFWVRPVGSTDPMATGGSNDEYGDPFDVMGDGPVPQGVFHSQAKQLLNWLAVGEWIDATANGSDTYRLHRIDHPDTTGVRGLRVNKAAGEYLWLSYRRLFDSKVLRAGANIVWERLDADRSWLIDTTPDSQPGPSDRTDGSLAIGRTFSTGNNHITALARGGSGAGEWLDVRVNTGPFAGNTAPVVTLSGPATIGARQSCVFTAQATDPNGDELAYSWDFGQGFTFDNNPSATFSWTVGGTFTVKVTVSDMKGNTVQATKSVTVTDSITTWNTRANTSVGNFYALAASPTKVIAVGQSTTTSTGPVATSTNGADWTPTVLGNNQHAFGAVWDGNQFLVAGEDYDFTTPAGWRGCVFTSPTANSGTWTRRIFTGSRLNGVAYGNGVHVAVGDDGTIRRSIDGGVNWTPSTSGTPNRLTCVSFGGGRFVAVGYDYFYVEPPATGGRYNGLVCVLTSTDGQTWTNTSAGAGLEPWQDFRSVKWTHDRFLASGFYGSVKTSTNLGVSFSTTRVQREETPAFAYGNGIWFAAGINWDASEADVDLVSADGVNWTNLTTPSLDDRNAAIFFNNTFITAGMNHSIRQSGVISPSAGGYFAWRENNLPDHGPLTTPEGDQDGDGVKNLIEYALGRSPNSGSGSDGPASLPQAIVASSDPLLTGRLVLQVDVPEPAAGDVVHVVEAASALDGTWSTLATKTGTAGWTWNAGGTSRIVTSAPSGGRVVVKVGDSVTISAESHRFLRLRTRVNQ